MLGSFFIGMLLYAIVIIAHRKPISFFELKKIQGDYRIISRISFYAWSISIACSTLLFILVVYFGFFAKK